VKCVRERMAAAPPHADGRECQVRHRPQSHRCRVSTTVQLTAERRFGNSQRGHRGPLAQSIRSWRIAERLR
jgi:hypothetical protein